MGRILKSLVFLALLGGIGLVVYGYTVDMAPAPQERRVPVQLDAG